MSHREPVAHDAAGPVWRNYDGRGLTAIPPWGWPPAGGPLRAAPDDEDVPFGDEDDDMAKTKDDAKARPGPTRRESLPVKLTADEQLAKGRELAAACAAEAEAEDHRKAEAKRLKELVDEAAGKVLDLRRIVESGEESRMVEVTDRVDWPSRTLDTVRLDTGEIVRSRPMTEAEIEEREQGSLFGEARAVEAKARDAAS